MLTACRFTLGLEQVMEVFPLRLLTVKVTGGATAKACRVVIPTQLYPKFILTVVIPGTRELAVSEPGPIDPGGGVQVTEGTTLTPETATVAELTE